MVQKTLQKPLSIPSDMNKLLYIGSSKFANMMNTERWQLTLGLAKIKEVRFFDLGNNPKKTYDIYKIWLSIGKSEAILFEDHEWSWKLKLPLSYRNVSKIPVPKWAFIADYWYELKEKQEYYEKNRITGLVALHQSSYSYIKKNFKNIKNIVSIPFTIDESEFCAPQKKEIDVLCSGFMGELYPFRRRLRDILLKQNIIKVLSLEHPGYWKNKEKIGLQGQDYYELMSKSKYVLSTTGIHNISVRKHIEAIGARSKILGNTTGFPEHRLISKFVLPINQEMGNQDILDTIARNCKRWHWSEENEKIRNYVIKTHNPYYVAKMLVNKITNI